MSNKATVDFIREANVGDMLWHFDFYHKSYVDGTYVRCGAWNLEEVQGSSLRFLKVLYSKFFRETGLTGYYPHCLRIAGQKEYETVMWMETHGRKVMRAVEHCQDIDKLKQIAEIVGYVDVP